MSPIVAIVGRPNVGKSTLFNRLVGRRLAIVHDTPGVTRDRHYADSHVRGRDMTLVDTGGFDPATDDAMGRSIARHVRAAIEQADVVLCVLDGAGGATQADHEAVKLLRRAHKPVVFAANRVDNAAQALEASELHALGVAPLVFISALHGLGMPELEAALVAALPSATATPPEEDSPEGSPPRLALIGRPNAGKSSLFNHLEGSERSLVDDRPGTTVDPVDTLVSYRDRPYLLVDTAGIRRRARVERGIESASVMRAIRAMERAQVIVLVCDVTEGVAEQDARLLGLCTDRGRAIVVALNKVDRIPDAKRSAAIEAARDVLHFAPWAPILPISAHTGHGVRKLMDAVTKASIDFARRIPTAELNRFFQEVLARRPPPTRGGHAPRIYYVTQAETCPPVFVVMSNAPEHIAPSYQRFIANRIRKSFDFEAVPIKLRFRKRRGRDQPGT